MAKLSAARRVALVVLSRCRRRDARARELLRNTSEMESLDARDRALVSRLVFGTISTCGLLDQVINGYVKKPSSLEPRVRDALRLSTFELCYLQTPSSVAVSQGVELVRSVTPRAAGLANAVLRKVAGADAPRIEEAHLRCEGMTGDASDLSWASGLPLWLTRRIVEERGLAAASELALCQLEPAPVYVAPNRARHSMDETWALLSDHGLGPQKTELPGCVRLASSASLADSGLVDGVDVAVSDLSAQRVAHMAQPLPGEHVLEIGQGRGTKTLLLQGGAIEAGGPCRIVGIDSEPFKAHISSERMERAGLSDWVTCLALDARTLNEPSVPDACEGPFDLVFVDAPCSGTGTMRRHPEIPWSLDESSLGEGGSLPSLQLQILSAAASRVVAGGRLLYATCSVLSEENEKVIEAFLASEEGAGFVVAEEGERPLTFQSMPQLDGPDGHYCCVLKRLS